MTVIKEVVEIEEEVMMKEVNEEVAMELGEEEEVVEEVAASDAVSPKPMSNMRSASSNTR